jgi:outer membrane biosynthesis protein TonB
MASIEFRRLLEIVFLAYAMAVGLPGLTEGHAEANDRSSDNAPAHLDANSNLTLPRLIRFRPPVYPESLRSRRLWSKVTLQALVPESGILDEIRVLKCEVGRKKKPDEALAKYCPEFEKAAIDLARELRYKPASRDGKPLAVYYTIRVDFDPRMLNGRPGS